MAIRFTNMFGNCPSGCFDRQYDQCAPAALCNICKNTGPEGSYNFNPNCWMRVDGKLVPKYEMDARRNVPVAVAGAGRLPMGVTESIQTARHSLPFRNADGITPFGVYSDNFGMPSGAPFNSFMGATRRAGEATFMHERIGKCKRCWAAGLECCNDTESKKHFCCNGLIPKDDKAYTFATGSRQTVDVVPSAYGHGNKKCGRCKKKGEHCCQDISTGKYYCCGNAVVNRDDTKFGSHHRNAVGVPQTQETVPSSEQVAGIGYCKKCYRRGYQCCKDMTTANKFVCCGPPVDPSKTRLRKWYDKWIGR